MRDRRDWPAGIRALARVKLISPLICVVAMFRVTSLDAMLGMVTLRAGCSRSRP